MHTQAVCCKLRVVNASAQECKHAQPAAEQACLRGAAWCICCISAASYQSLRGCQAAAFAQNWAARCEFKHSGSRTYGENLYLSSNWQGEAAAVQSWYSVCSTAAAGSYYRGWFAEACLHEQT